MTAQKLVLALTLLCVWLECEAKSFDIKKPNLVPSGVIALQDEELQELFSERLNVTIPPPVVPAVNFTIDIPEPKDFDNTNTRPRGGDADEDSFNSASRTCQCGKANTGSRIVGGIETLVNEYPWQVGLVKETDGVKNLICGGSIISNHWVLTAAHCIDSNALEVLVGDHDFTTGTETQDPAYLYAVNWKVVHPNYVNVANEFDIALLHTTQPLDFTKYGQAPVCLPPDRTRLYVGETATVSGWGTTSEGGSISPTLQEADLLVYPNSYCNRVYDGIILDSMLCAAARGKDSCQGDSGGPLVYNNNGRYELIGIVSFGKSCARPAYPGVYSRVTSYVDWIQRYTGNLCTAT